MTEDGFKPYFTQRLEELKSLKRTMPTEFNRLMKKAELRVHGISGESIVCSRGMRAQVHFHVRVMQLIHHKQAEGRTPSGNACTTRGFQRLSSD